MFNEETRTNIQRNLTGFGNAFAGRGPQLNEAFSSLRKLAESAQPVLRSLVAPSTNFDGFWRSLEAFASTVAPVALTQSDLFVALDRTFGAFARVSRPFIQETISKGPPFLDAAARDLPVLRPFLHDSARFFTAFGPGRRRSPIPRRRSTRRFVPASRRSTARRRCSPSSSRRPMPCSRSRKHPAPSTGSTS